MAESNMFAYIIVALAVIGLVIVTGIKAAAPISITTTPPQEHTLSVAGTHEIEVAPDQAVLVVQVMTRNAKAPEASAENRALLRAVMDTVKAQGVAADDIETTGILLDRWIEYEKVEADKGLYLPSAVDKGFQQTTTLKITVKDLEKVGTVLDAAIKAGANSVQEISFELRPETETRLKQDALTQATLIAKKKAEVLAQAAGTTIGPVSMISENSWVQPWLYNSKSYESVAMDAGSAPQISPQKVTLSVSVNLNYALE